jgi:hypothetical protein
MRKLEDGMSELPQEMQGQFIVIDPTDAFK